ncbi:hypothetical protein K1X41_09950 [Leucobacter luti]|nr:hypothetical protein K1X41_09950 [Leucobacter luti]
MNWDLPGVQSGAGGRKTHRLVDATTTHPQRAHAADEGPRLRQRNQYDPDTDTGFSGANYFPVGLPRETFYEPTAHGYEHTISQRLDRWAHLRNGTTGTPTAQSEGN